MTEWVITSSFLILVVLALRAALGEKISAGLRYALWGVVLVRLLVPFSLAVTVSPIPVWTPPEALSEKSIYVLPVGSADLDSSGVRVLEDGTLEDANSFGYPRLADDGERVVRYAEKISPLELLDRIWLAGAAVMGGVLAWTNVRFFRRLRRARKPLEGTNAPIPVYAANGLPSPCLVGVLRPAVYVTPEAAADAAMLRHVLAHELTHYNHRDHLWSVLRGAALAAHWWNPLVWLAVAYSRRDGELACDEGALRQLGDGERTAYGETLLNLVTAKGKPGDLLCFATTMAGGKGHLRERIQRIARQPKVLVSAIVAAVAVISFAGLAAFAQAKSPSAPDDASVPPPGDTLPVETQPAGTRIPQDDKILVDDGLLRNTWVTAPQDQPRVIFPDLDHDGIMDILEVEQAEYDWGTQWTVKFASALTSSLSSWEGEAATPHVGWTSFYLCRLDERDYLLQYTPYMSGGGCYYAYKLFYFTPSGEEMVVQQNEVDFDLVFAPEFAGQHHFDPEAIAAFMAEINALLEKSELLVNTDENLQGTFQKEGRLYDSIWWLDDELLSNSEVNALLAALDGFSAYAADHPEDVESPLGMLLEDLEPGDIGDISAQSEVTPAQLVELLRKTAASRASRYHTYGAFAEEGAQEWTRAGWAVPLADSGTLHLLACESGNVEMCYETAGEATSAFYDQPGALYDLICKAGMSTHYGDQAEVHHVEPQVEVHHVEPQVEVHHEEPKTQTHHSDTHKNHHN